MLSTSSAFILTSVIVVATTTVTVVVCGDDLHTTGSLNLPPGSGSEGKFERFARIFPVLHHAADGKQLTVSYVLDGSNVTLDLQREEELLPGKHFLAVQNTTSDAEEVQLQLTQMDQHELELCHYHGTVRGHPESYVALSTCDGIRGVVYDHDETYFLEFEDQAHYVHKQVNATAEHSRTKRAIEAFNEPPTESFRTAYKANRASSYVELVLVVDRKLYDSNRNVQRVQRYCFDLVNIMNAIYRPLNIYIALVGVVIWSDQDAIEISTDSRKTLDNFLEYRRTTLLKMIPHDNAHLLTGVHFKDNSGDGVVVGKAELGSMCTFAGSGGVEVVDTGYVALQASTVAHEMGHNFNMDHDEAGCECPNGNCVMAPRTVRSQAAPNRWSSCSVEHLETALQHGVGACLKNKPARMFVKATCGNGLLEPGEECDCGTVDSCDSKCCNPTNCRLTTNSTCAEGECCDLASCQLKSAGMSCRTATGECDLPEFCDGQSAICPKDVYLRDTEPCSGGKAYCFSGQCRTHDTQCRLLWGSTGRSISDLCYQTNLNGSIFGNCGNNLLTGEYTKCTQEDMMCGLLHCNHRNEKLDYGMSAYSKLTTTKFNTYGPRGTVRETVCNTAIVDLGLQVLNPGLVPDGAKCGTGKVCWQQRCVSLSHLKENDIGEDCEGGCSDHGVCNSEGHCHCDEGYGGEFCEKSGHGGSVDSGPILDADDSAKTKLAVYISCTILLFIGLAVLLYLRRDFLWDQLRKVLEKFRARKYGHMIPPASPTIIAPPKPPRLEVSAPTVSVIPSRAAPPLPPTAKQQPEPAQHFIKVNINKGKVTIENKVVNSPFMLTSTLLDAHEAVHEMKARGTPAILEQRSVSVDSEGPLLAPNSTTDVPPPPHTPEPDLGTLITQIKLKKVQDFHTNRSKSDEKPPRRLPELPRQKTIGEFQSVVAEVHPKRSPATDEPSPPNPFGQVTLKKVKPRTPNLSRENLDEITQEKTAIKKQWPPPAAAPKPTLSRTKPSLPQKPQQSADNHQPSGGSDGTTSKITRKLPQIPTTGPNISRNRPPLLKKPAIVEQDAEPTAPSGVAALKAKLNLDQMAGGIKR